MKSQYINSLTYNLNAEVSYLLMTRQNPVEGQYSNSLTDNLNAEVGYLLTEFKRVQ